MLLGLIEVWSLALPLFGAPDEPAHVIKAVGAARGQLLGRPTEVGTVRIVRVPAGYATAGLIPGCFVFKGDKDASCAPSFDGRPGVQLVETAAGTYPPLYYVIVGVPTLLVSGEVSIYLMRFFGAMAVAALVASALASAALLPRPRAAIIAISATVTPMLLFLGGSVNPSSFEIAAGIAVWASGLTLLSIPDHPELNRVIWRFTVASCALVWARPLSPAIFALILLFLAAYGDRSTLKSILSWRPAQWCSAGIFLMTAMATGWVLAVGGQLGQTVEAVEPVAGLPRLILGRQDLNFRQMIGVFGWLDTNSPALTYELWIAAIGLFVFLAWAVGRGRRRWLVLLAGLASVAVPWLLEIRRAQDTGVFWQGRYTMPFAAGVLVMAGFTIAQGTEREGIVDRLVRQVPIVLAVATLLAYMQFCRRWSVGTGGPLFFLASARWHPLLTWWVLVPLSAACLTAAVLALSRLDAQT